MGVIDKAWNGIGTPDTGTWTALASLNSNGVPKRVEAWLAAAAYCGRTAGCGSDYYKD